jgi:methionyl-tRNA formyltransferase
MNRFSATIHLATIVVATIILSIMTGFTFRPCYAFQAVLTRPTALGSSVRIPSRVSNTGVGKPSSFGSILPRYPIHHIVKPSFQLKFSTSSQESIDSTKARILFLGTPDVAATSLKSIYEHSQTSNNCPYTLVGVVTQPPKRRKRGGSEIPSPVGFIAEELGLPILCPESARDVSFLEMLENNVKPDLCITAAYGQYLPKRFLSLPKFGTLNIHPSLLPRWRGSSPVQRSLEAGDTEVGVSVLFTVSKMDAGPIVSQHSMDIDDNEQATTLLPKLFDIGTEKLLEALPKVIEGSITMETATKQDESLVVEANMIDSSEGQLHPSTMSAVQCHNRVRGFAMWPGTFIYIQIGDEGVESVKEPIKMKVIESRVLPEKAEPTNIIEIGPKKGDGLRLVCADGSMLEMRKVQPATRNVMDAKSFVNGLQGQTVRWLSVYDEES